METAFECSICLDSCVEPVTALCGQHNFCLDCLRGWIQSNRPDPKCPHCRLPIQTEASALRVNIGLRDAIEARSGACSTPAVVQAAAATTVEPYRVPFDAITFETRRGARVQIGYGAFAAVFAGKFEGEPVAVKVITLTRAQAKAAGAQDKFWREAKLQYSLRHDNVVAVLGAAVDDSEPDLPMELAIIQPRMATSLHDWLHDPEGEGKRANAQRRLTVLVQIAAGIRYVHAKNIVHGDLKPGNVMLDSLGVARLTDFGLATLRPDYATTHTSQQGMQGTLPYMDPGLLSGSWGLRKASDVYSFGILAWEVMSGQKPYNTLAPFQLQRHIEGGGRPDHSLLRPDTPAGLHALLTDCWKYRFAERPQLEEVYQRLRSILSESSSTQLPTPGAAPPPTATRPPATAETQPRPSAPPPSLLGTAALPGSSAAMATARPPAQAPALAAFEVNGRPRLSLPHRHARGAAASTGARAGPSAPPVSSNLPGDASAQYTQAAAATKKHPAPPADASRPRPPPAAASGAREGSPAPPHYPASRNTDAERAGAAEELTERRNFERALIQKTSTPRYSQARGSAGTSSVRCGWSSGGHSSTTRMACCPQGPLTTPALWTGKAGQGRACCHPNTTAG